MAGIRRLWLGLACALIAAPAFAAPLEAYGRLPSIEDAAISASGDKVAVVVTNGEERRIVVKDLVQNRITFLATVGTTKVRRLQWAGDEHLVLTSSRTNSESVEMGHAELFFAADIDLKKRVLNPLFPEVGEGSFRIILGMPIVRMIDGRPAVFLHGLSVVNSRGIVSLVRIDLDDQKRHPLETGRVNGENYIVGPDGRVLAQVNFNRPAGKWWLNLKTPSGWREAVARDEPVDEPDVLGLGRDGRSVIVTEDERAGFGWREVSLESGVAGDAIPVAPAQSPIHDPLSGRLIGTRALVGDQSRYTFFNAQDARVWSAVEAAFGGDRVELVSWSNDRRKILVRVDSAASGPAYAIVDLATRKASWLGAEYEGLGPADIAPVQPVHFKAADGLEISGYLTLPRGREARALPLIVFPHGGPAARDEPGFDWWAQAMASRGYAVLQVNFRGSDGFGWDFTKAGFGEWGRKMQTDLSDGVRYLGTKGTIDPKRVCIVGGSYGGYAALAGVTIEKGVYRCAVSFGGVADLKRMVADARKDHSWTSLRYWERFMGAQTVGDPVLARYSPALLASEASAPILLIHGRDDTVVPLAQSQEMADALKKAGKPVDLVVQNNADHWLSLGETRLEMLRATMAFVEKHNPPQ